MNLSNTISLRALVDKAKKREEKQSIKGHI
jgi:hypothetical protein